MNSFYGLDISKVFFGNTKQLLEAETKLIHITHLEAFLMDNVLLLKYMYILFSHKLLHVM